MTLQIRPKDNADAPAYCPQRDIAYCFPGIVTRTIRGLRDAKVDSWLMTHMYQMCSLRGGCSEAEVREELARACLALAQGVRRFHEPSWADPGEALQEFRELPVPVQVAVMAKIGQLMTGAFFTAVRDVTDWGAEAPKAVDIPSLVAAADEAAESLRNPVRARLKRFLSQMAFWRKS
jgi:hypothetical protein